MKIVNVRELRLNTRKVLASMASGGPILITRRGRPIALMRALPDHELDERFSPLWERARSAAERAGYGKRDVPRLICEARAKAR